jgi:hypothetical protein
MDLLGRPFADIDDTVLNRLVDERIEEDAHLEFKQALPDATDEGRVEFLKDASAFANTNGGILLYGIAEVEGRASKIIGVTHNSADSTIRRLEETFTSGVEPRVGGVIFRCVSCSEGDVVAMLVPRSLAAPHMVTRRQTGQFWMRGNRGKGLMSVSQIRQAMLAATEWERAASGFRDARLHRIRTGQGLRGIPADGVVVLHVLPLGGPRDRVDLPRATPKWEAALFPGGTASSQGFVARPNADGWLASTGQGERHVQIFRDSGGLEARFDLKGFMRSIAPDRALDAVAVELELAKWTEKASLWFAAGNVEPPYAVFISILGALGTRFFSDNPSTSFLHGDYAIDVQDVLLPEQLLVRRPDVLAGDLNAMFDAFWQSASWPRSAARSDDGVIWYRQSLSGVAWP